MSITALVRLYYLHYYLSTLAKLHISPKNPGDVLDTFYASIPETIYWPIFVVAVANAIIASQAMISAQLHEYDLLHFVTFTFKITKKIGNAYGIAVVGVMSISTCLFIPISTVMLEERFLFRHVKPREYRMFYCVVRYGYKDKIEEPNEFENQLVKNLKEFMRHEQYIVEARNGITKNELIAPEPLQDTNSINVTQYFMQIITGPVLGVGEEMQFVQNVKEKIVVYLLREADVVAKQDSSSFNKIIVNNAYSFLKKNQAKGKDSADSSD
ncbi:hypothetical protein POM88_037608 [Heracleum sosnowskyi]|uniref:Uncharacterized protein n=1 Tax=Heracleum sosnowskyi TaxID=360622 RepID=A0AAD8HRG3_9APIA|nr:hypothetical protein POM88_037608 [Heracleum sosnowskyi]